MKRKNYTKYIATRETVEKREQNQLAPNAATTEKQKEMLSELLSDFPEAKRYLEYEDYTAHPTVQNAGELITTIIERHADVIGNRQNFVGYMAKRPGAEQRGAHGLFNDSDEPIVLNQVANEVAHHKGNVWSHVVSLRREDAIRLGYDNSDRWRELVKRQIPVIAEQSRISMSNLKWYAAFHDTTHHPHIHLIAYSTNPKQGYLSREGIDKIRSAFANDIFHDDLQSIYQEQTLSRDELKSISQEQVHQIVMQIQNSTFNNPQLEKLVKKLHEQLQTVSGKKVYGYLPQDVKRTVDDILAELAKDKQISQLYEKWCELERLKHKIYTQKEPELPALADNKVFKPVKNMIIRAVLNMNMPAISPYSVPQNDDSDDTAFSDIDNDVFTWNDEDAVEVEVESSNLHIQWSKDYKRACKKYLDALIAMGLIEVKEHRYSILNSYVDFWHRFFYLNVGRLVTAQWMLQGYVLSQLDEFTLEKQLPECIKKLPFHIPKDAKRQYNGIFDYVFQSGSHTILIKLPETLDWHCTKQELDMLLDSVTDYCGAFYKAEICVMSFHRFSNYCVKQAGQLDNLYLVVG